MKIKLSGFWVYAITLLICLGLLQAGTDISFAATYGIDLWIGGNQGDNYYGGLGTGGGGSRHIGIPGGTTGSFEIAVQNEGDSPDYFELSWDTPAGWYSAIRHQDGSLLNACDNEQGSSALRCVVILPPSDSPCPYFNDTNTNGQFDANVDQCLALAGEVIPLTLEVRPPSSFISGNYPFIVDGKSIGDTQKVDSVRARVWANAVTITVTSVTSNSATVSWTGPSWQADTYDLRYSTSEIIEDGVAPVGDQVNFSNAAQVNGLSTPVPGGSESFTVTNLYANTPYYFALKTKYDASYTSVISLCNKASGVPPIGITTCPASTLASTDTVSPSTITDLAVTDATSDSVTLCWTAPQDQVFFDDFNDGTLAPWNQIRIEPDFVDVYLEVFNDPTDGWVLKKMTDGHPAGGYAPLGRTVTDYSLSGYTKRTVLNPGFVANAYSLTDGNGNGYAFFANFATGFISIRRQDTWNNTVVIGSQVSVPGGLLQNQWYTFRLRRQGNNLTGEIFLGRNTVSPLAAVTVADSAYSAFTQVNVGGGYEYYTDDIRVDIPVSGHATSYLLKYDTEYIVENGATPKMGEVTFDEAIDEVLKDNKGDDDGICETGEACVTLGVPKTGGASECYRVKVQNILAGSDGQPGTVDDMDRTPNTQFFFAIKAQDEQGAQGQSKMSNVAAGLTAMSSQMFNMVSVPRVPNPNTPTAVFGDDVGSPLYLYWWDSRGIGHDRGCYDGSPDQYNPNGEDPPCLVITDSYPLSTGKGYFLWSPALDAVLDAPATSTDTPAGVCKDENNQDFFCFIFPLQEGWNMIGNPFEREVNMSAVKVRQTRQQGPNMIVTTVPFVTAVTARNWIGNAIYIHNGANYTYEFCDDTGCSPVLQPWKGYWIWLHKQGDGGANTAYDLLIPKP